jgi:hypothetical protein
VGALGKLPRCGSRMISAAPLISRGTESSQTRRWREMDSNHRYPAKFFWLPRRSPRNSPPSNINRLARDRDRWFESISLHRRISCEPEAGLVWLSAQIIPPLWRRDSNGPRRYRPCPAEIPREREAGRDLASIEVTLFGLGEDLDQVSAWLRWGSRAWPRCSRRRRRIRCCRSWTGDENHAAG